MKNYNSKHLLQDPKAPPSKPGKPYFIREKGAQVYTGFPLIQETETDSFIFGAISDFLEPDSKEGCTTGDAYIQAPDGSRAGIVWQVFPNNEKKITLLRAPEEGRWGVYNVGFPKPITSLEDLIYNFREVLPLLKEQYENKFSGEELKILSSITEEFSRRAKHHRMQTFYEFISRLFKFVRGVEIGYSTTIDNYTNSLYMRSQTEEIMKQVSPTIKKKLSNLIKAWDYRFDKATNIVNESLVCERPEWWFHRLPKILIEELKRDVESLNIK